MAAGAAGGASGRGGARDCAAWWDEWLPGGLFGGPAGESTTPRGGPREGLRGWGRFGWPKLCDGLLCASMAPQGRRYRARAWLLHWGLSRSSLGDLPGVSGALLGRALALCGGPSRESDVCGPPRTSP